MTLNYKEFPINDFSGGLTDDFKSLGVRYKKFTNLIIAHNKTAVLRDGMSLNGGTTSDDIKAMEVLNDRIIAQTGNNIEYQDHDYYACTKPVPSTDLFTSPNIAMAKRWRNSVLVNVDTDDHIARVIETPTDIRASRSSLKAVRDAIIGGTGSGDQRLYSVCLIREYTDVDGFKYREYSPDSFGSTLFNTTVTVTGVTVDADSGIGIAPIAISGGLTEYFTDEIKVALYLSKENSTQLHLAKEVTYASYIGTGAFGYTIDDDILTKGEVCHFYSEEPKIAVPKCDYFAIGNDTAWYLGVDGLPYRVYQSVQGIPSSVLADGYKDLDHNGNGIGVLKGTPIILTDDRLYRIDGAIGVDGLGTLREVKVQGSEGGISHNSIVIANDKMYYAGTDGFYVTDGYKAINITGSYLYETYSELTKDKSTWKFINGTFDRDNNIIYWVMGDKTIFALTLDSGGISEFDFSNSLNGDNNIRSIKSIYIPNSNIVGTASSEDSRSISTPYSSVVINVNTIRRIGQGSSYKVEFGTEVWEGVATDVDDDTLKVTLRFDTPVGSPLPATVISNKTMYEGGSESSRQLLIGTSLDTVMSMRSGIAADTVIPSGATGIATDWDETPILFDLLSAGINYGSSTVKKWVKDVTFSIKSLAKFSAEPYVIREDNEVERELKVISNIKDFGYFNPNDIWGRDTAFWSADNVMSAKRHIPKGLCRCRTNQIGIKSTITGLYSSRNYQDLSIVSFNANNIVAELIVTADTPRLPYDLIGSYITIRLSGDEEWPESKLLITAVSTDRRTITFARTNEVILTVGDLYEWFITGHPVRQQFEIMNMNIRYAMLDNSGNGYQRGSDASSDPDD